MMGEIGQRQDWKAESTGPISTSLLFSEVKCLLTSLSLSFPVWKSSY